MHKQTKQRKRTRLSIALSVILAMTLAVMPLLQYTPQAYSLEQGAIAEHETLTQEEAPEEQTEEGVIEQEEILNEEQQGEQSEAAEEGTEEATVEEPELLEEFEGGESTSTDDERAIDPIEDIVAMSATEESEQQEASPFAVGDVYTSNTGWICEVISETGVWGTQSETVVKVIGYSGAGGDHISLNKDLVKRPGSINRDIFSIESVEIVGVGSDNRAAITGMLCANNDTLTSFDVSGCVSLVTLSVFKNKALASIDISDCTALENLTCSNGKLTSIDLSSNTKLVELSLHNNLLTDLNLSNNTKIEKLTVNKNKFESIDISMLSELADLMVAQNQITSIDVSQNQKLDGLFVWDNPLISLDVSNNPLLTRLNCSLCAIEELDLSSNPLLQMLICSSNQLTELDVSNNPLLSGTFECSKNQLLDIVGWQVAGMVAATNQEVEIPMKRLADGSYEAVRTYGFESGHAYADSSVADYNAGTGRFTAPVGTTMPVSGTFSTDIANNGNTVSGTIRFVRQLFDYDVTFDSKGADNGSDYDSLILTMQEDFCIMVSTNFPADPVKAGNTFKGWQYEDPANPGVMIPVTPYTSSPSANITLEALWVPSSESGESGDIRIAATSFIMSKGELDAYSADVPANQLATLVTKGKASAWRISDLTDVAITDALFVGGVPTTTGSYQVTYTADDGIDAASVTVSVVIHDQVDGTLGADNFSYDVKDGALSAADVAVLANATVYDALGAVTTETPVPDATQLAAINDAIANRTKGDFPLKFTNAAGDEVTVTVSLTRSIYDVTFDSKGADNAADYDTLVVPVMENTAIESAAGFPVEPTRDGYVFRGWQYDDPANPGTMMWLEATTLMPSDDVELVAAWEQGTAVTVGDITIVASDFIMSMDEAKDHQAKTPADQLQELITRGKVKAWRTDTKVDAVITLATVSPSKGNGNSIDALTGDYQVTYYAGQGAEEVSVTVKAAVYDTASSDGSIGGNDFTYNIKGGALTEDRIRELGSVTVYDKYGRPTGEKAVLTPADLEKINAMIAAEQLGETELTFTNAAGQTVTIKANLVASAVPDPDEEPIPDPDPKKPDTSSGTDTDSDKKGSTSGTSGSKGGFVRTGDDITLLLIGGTAALLSLMILAGVLLRRKRAQ